MSRRQLMRYRDVEDRGPLMRASLLAFATLAIVAGAHVLRLEGGVDAFEDGNRRVSSYLHYQVPIVTDAGTWIARASQRVLRGFSGSASPSAAVDRVACRQRRTEQRRLVVRGAFD